MSYKSYLKEIGNRLRKERVRLGYTQKELADLIASKSDLSDKQISRFECGENGTRIDKLVELSLALKKTPDYFLLGIDRSDEYLDRLIDSIDEKLRLLGRNDLELVSMFIETLHSRK